MADSISGASDSELMYIVDQVKSMLATHAADYPMITAAMKSDLDTLRDSFNDKVTASAAAQAAAKAATMDKHTKRSAVEKAIRDIRNMCKAGGVDETKMAALGIPTGSTGPTPTVPVAVVDTSQRMRHTISWSDASANGSKRKPRGTMGAEIWYKIGDPGPTSEKECTFLTLDSSSPYLVHFDAADSGKTAFYMIRWRLQDGTTGAWGDTVSATITA